MFDASEVYGFASHLASVTVTDEWEQTWGARMVDELRDASPDDTGFLDSQTEQVAPGEITFGDADYWRYLNYGTVYMAPRDFIGEAEHRIRGAAARDAARLGREWLER